MTKKKSNKKKNTWLKHDKIKRYADFRLERSKSIEVLKNSCYCVVEGYSITGEAPKKFIKVYDDSKIGGCRKGKIHTWTLYLAKTGSKWYPLESITEYLIAKIGDTIGLEMAQSRLVQAGGQVRFLSKYFLGQDQELIHASNIMATYLGDRELILDIEKRKMEKEFFTVDETILAIKTCFPDDQELILEKFFLMLFFDAWVGVQDRHFYNWGVVRHINNKHRPYFSPIYDSARGLFWNESDKKIKEWSLYKQFDQQIERRCKKSEPQFGISTKGAVNHFDLIEYLWQSSFIQNTHTFKQIFSSNALEAVTYMVISEFSKILNQNRLELILRSLKNRHDKLYLIMTQS